MNSSGKKIAGLLKKTVKEKISKVKKISLGKYSGFTHYVVYLDLLGEKNNFRYVLGRCKLLFYMKKKMVNLLECAPHEKVDATVIDFQERANTYLIQFDSDKIKNLQLYVSDCINALSSKGMTETGDTFELTKSISSEPKKGGRINFSSLRVGIEKDGKISNFVF